MPPTTLPAIIPAKFFFDTIGFEVGVGVEVGAPEFERVEVCTKTLMDNDVLGSCAGIMAGA